MGRALLVILGLACATPGGTAQSAMRLSPSSGGQDPSRAIEYLEDANGQLGWEDLHNPEVNERFRPPGARGLNFGFTGSAYWYRLALENPADAVDSNWVLEVAWPPIDAIDLYVETGDGAVQQIRGGEERAPGASGIEHRVHALPFTLQPGERAQLAMRVQLDGAHQLPTTLWTASAFARKTARENLYFGMFYGVMMVTIIYNLLMYLAARDAVFLTYVLFLGSITGLLSLLDGFAQPLLWPLWPPLVSYATAVGTACSALTLALFTRVAMQTRERNPLLHRGLNGLLAIDAVCVVTPLAPSLVLSTMVNAAAGGVTAAYAAVVIAVQAFRGRRAAQIFACLWMVLLAGIVIKVLQVSGILPVHPLTVYSIHIGLAVLATTLSLTLAEMLNHQRRTQTRLIREKAEARAAAQREFLTKMSHELRTPMNAIIGFTDLALRDPDGPRRSEHLAKIDRGARALLHTINEVLDLSRLESGRITMEQRHFALPGLLERLEASVRGQLAAGVDFSLHCDDQVPVLLVGDEWRLAQLLGLLLDNAAKFTAAGEVRLTVSCVERRADAAELEFLIADTGVGIPEQRQADLFKPFAQADQSMTRAYAGSGLGLAICKQIVDAMGGHIALDSASGQGTRFRIRLRFGLGQSLRAAAAQAPIGEGPGAFTPQRAQGRRVLLVEDNEMNRDLATQILQDAGVLVETADNGAEAVAAASNQDFDLVLMDVQMPVMDGFTATRRIRESMPADRLPIVAMTANALPQDREDATAAGMNDFLPKPIDADQVIRLLARWLPEQGIEIEPVGEELNTLRVQVAGHEFAARACFNAIADRLRLQFHPREVEDLESALAAFDFERALGTIEVWCQAAGPAAAATVETR